jgi:hypothetical protein
MTDDEIKRGLANLTRHEWAVGTSSDNSGDGHEGIFFIRWPRSLRRAVHWPRNATGQAIAHELRKLADALEEADDA